MKQEPPSLQEDNLLQRAEKLSSLTKNFLSLIAKLHKVSAKLPQDNVTSKLRTSIHDCHNQLNTRLDNLDELVLKFHRLEKHDIGDSVCNRTPDKTLH